MWSPHSGFLRTTEIALTLKTLYDQGWFPNRRPPPVALLRAT
jgi:hypothetical protein